FVGQSQRPVEVLAPPRVPGYLAFQPVEVVCEVLVLCRPTVVAASRRLPPNGLPIYHQRDRILGLRGNLGNNLIPLNSHRFRNVVANSLDSIPQLVAPLLLPGPVNLTLPRVSAARAEVPALPLVLLTAPCTRRYHLLSRHHTHPLSVIKLSCLRIRGTSSRRSGPAAWPRGPQVARLCSAATQAEA